MDNKGPQMLDPNMWVDRYGDYLFRCAVGYVKDHSLAEDIVQETFLAALQSSASFTGQSSPATWLVGILKHKVMDHFRKTKRCVQPFEEDPTQSKWADDSRESELRKGIMAAAHDQTDPGMMAERAEFWDVLTKGLTALSPQVASAFALREIDQLSSTDICRKLGVSEANLWVMLHRARKHLRDYFETNGFKNHA
jgi:RNA polymerase sigma-70 factor (ECF subfamily)